MWKGCSDSPKYGIQCTIHSDCDYIVENIRCRYFLDSFATETAKNVFVCCICRYVIQHLFHNHIKVQLTRCMEFKAISAPINMGLLQANTGGWGNSLKVYDVVNVWYVGPMLIVSA